MGPFRVAFEATTLNEAQARAAGGKVASQGDGGEAILWLCYSTTGRHGDEAIWLVSSSEMGGLGHSVTDVIGKSIDKKDPAIKCPRLPPNLSPLTIGPGVWLGSSVQETLQSLRGLTRISGDWYVYEYSGQVPDSCQPGGMDRVKWLTMRVAKGYVVEIHAGQTTTC
jgi:hypothetical protein